MSLRRQSKPVLNSNYPFNILIIKRGVDMGPQERFQEIQDDLHHIFMRKEWLRNNGMSDSSEMRDIIGKVDLLNKEKKGLISDVDFSLVRFGKPEKDKDNHKGNDENEIRD